MNYHAALSAGGRSLLVPRTGRFADQTSRQIVVFGPRAPDISRPLPHTPDVLVRVRRAVYVSDGQAASPLRESGGPGDVRVRAQPLLHHLIEGRRVFVFDGGAHARQVRGERLARTHVFVGVLERVGVHRQAVDSAVAVIAEL